MKRDNHLDDIDRKLLRALQRNASTSHAILAELVGSSPASCWRRIKAMEATGILKGPVRLVDPEKIGCDVNVMCQLRMKSHANPVRQQFETFLNGRPEIMECYSMSGEWDYLMRVVVPDVSSYEHFLMGVLLNHPNVATAASHFALNQVKYTTALPV